MAPAAAPRALMAGSGLLEDMPFRRPSRAQILAHVEIARQRVALDAAREGEDERVAILLGIEAAEAHGVAVDGAGEVAGDEVALGGAVDLVAPLPQVQDVPRVAGGVSDSAG